MQKSTVFEQCADENRNYLLALWAEILGGQDISPDSDFFELGGDSIQMMTMLFRVSQDLGVELSPGTVFEAPTPAQLAFFLAGIQADCSKDEGNQRII